MILKTVNLKRRKINPYTYGYKLSKEQIKNTLVKEPVKVDKFKVNSNLIFFSLDYGYCLIRKKMSKLLNGEEVWLVELYIDRKDIIREMYLSEKQIRNMISLNILVKDSKGNNKGYKIPLLNANLI